jgi:hypothetical protein
MIKLKDILKEEYVPKPIHKAQHARQVKLAKKITMDMQKLVNQFRKDYKVDTSNRVLYNTMKEWEELLSTAKMKYEGWFEFAKDDSDYVV